MLPGYVPCPGCGRVINPHRPGSHYKSAFHIGTKGKTEARARGLKIPGAPETLAVLAAVGVEPERIYIYMSDPGGRKAGFLAIRRYVPGWIFNIATTARGASQPHIVVKENGEKVLADTPWSAETAPQTIFLRRALQDPGLRAEAEAVFLLVGGHGKLPRPAVDKSPFKEWIEAMVASWED